MKKAKKAENPIRKIIGICLILLFVMGVGVMASNAKLYNVKIILSNGYIMNVTTSKTKVSEILDENHIILLPEESVIPNEDSELSDNKTIKISKDEQQTVEVAENAETSENVTVETLLKTYDSIVEKLEEDIRCPLEYGLAIFGGKWKSRIICVLSANEKLRYSQIRKEMYNITDAVLSATLKDLMEDGIVDRKSYDEIPPRVEYSLTQKGKSVVPILQSICQWSDIFYIEEGPDEMVQC